MGKKRKLLWKPLFRWLALLVIAMLIFAFIANVIVERKAAHTFNSTREIPKNKVGLLLGTSKYISSGNINQYYRYRIDAAAHLFRSGKIEYILISGDNGTQNYNEPETMKADLVAAGIPENNIYLDYAGFRTLDSVVRCKAIFGQTKITVISQQFHNEKAIYLAGWNGIEAVGFNAKDVKTGYGFKTRFRESLARPKMVLDLIFGKKPKYLGEKIEIE